MARTIRKGDRRRRRTDRKRSRNRQRGGFGGSIKEKLKEFGTGAKRFGIGAKRFVRSVTQKKYSSEQKEAFTHLFNTSRILRIQKFAC